MIFIWSINNQLIPLCKPRQQAAPLRSEFGLLAYNRVAEARLKAHGQRAGVSIACQAFRFQEFNAE